MKRQKAVAAALRTREIRNRVWGWDKYRKGWRDREKERGHRTKVCVRACVCV